MMMMNDDDDDEGDDDNDDDDVEDCDDDVKSCHFSKSHDHIDHRLWAGACSVACPKIKGKCQWILGA